MRPEARQDRLIIQELDEELLVYDLERHRAHSLNRAAAVVWRRCDGRTPVAELAEALQREAGLPRDEEVVWMALERLERAHLLRAPLARPGEPQRYSRRELARRLGQVGVVSALLPGVLSIVAPTAAQAASCKADGLPCSQNSECCGGRCFAGVICQKTL